MSPLWLSGCFAAGVVAVLFAGVGVRRASLLEQKVRVLHRLVFALAAIASGAGIGVLLLEPLPRVATGSLPPTESDLAAWCDVARKQLEASRRWLAAVSCLGAFALVPVALVLRELESFALRHRLDLAARDQVLASRTPSRSA